MGSSVRAKQRCPGGPKFSSEACVEHQRLAVDLAEHDINRPNNSDNVSE
jgi:hypothetical protein